MATVTIVQQVVRPGLRPQTQATTWRAVPTATLFVQTAGGMAYVEYGPQTAFADGAGVIRLPLPTQDVCRPSTIQWIVESSDGAAWQGPITSDMPAAVSIDDLTQLWGWRQTALPGGVPAHPDIGVQGPGSLRYADAFAPYVVTGLSVTAGPGLQVVVAPGAAYVGDPAHPDRDPKAALTAAVPVPVPANLPAAYVDWAPARGPSGFSISLAPTPTPGSLRLRQLSSTGTAVTLGADLRGTSLAFTIPVSVQAALQVGSSVPWQALPGASADAPGAIRLAGDLGGTPTQPTVTALSHVAAAALPGTLSVAGDTTLTGKLALSGAFGSTGWQPAVNRLTGLPEWRAPKSVDLVHDYGAVSDAVNGNPVTGTDNTAALNQALADLSATGGDIWVPGNASLLFSGQIVIPMDVTNRIAPIRILAAGVRSFNSKGATGAIFYLGYQDPNIDHVFPRNAKIIAQGIGAVSLENLQFTAAQTGDYTPILKATGAQLLVHRCTFTGNTTGGLENSAFIVAGKNAAVWQGRVSHLDAIILGDSTDSTQAVDNGFSGYGTVISECKWIDIRRPVACDGAANTVICTDGEVQDNCGNTGTPWNAAFDIHSYPGATVQQPNQHTVANTSIGMSGYGAAIRIGGKSVTVSGNAYFDPTRAVTLQQDVPPATWLTQSFAAGSGTLVTAGYQPPATVAVELNPIVTLTTALSAGQTAAAITVTGTGDGLLPGGWTRGGYVRLWDVDAIGNPIPSRQETLRISTVTDNGNGTYTLTFANAVANAYAHTAGTPIQLYPAVVTNQVQVGDRQFTATGDCGGRLAIGTMIHLMEMTRAVTASTVTGNLVAPQPRFIEWAVITSKTGPDAVGNVVYGLDRPFNLSHNLGQSVSVSVAGVTSTSVFTANSAAALMVGVPVTVGTQTSTISAIAGNVVTVSPPFAALPVVNQAVTQIASTACISIWETAAVTAEPTVAAIAALGGSTAAGATNATIAGSIPAGVQRGTPIVFQGVTSNTGQAGTNVQATNVLYRNATEWTTVRDVGGSVVYVDPVLRTAKTVGGTNVLFGPFSYAITLGHNHVPYHRVLTASIITDMWLPKASNLGYTRWAAGYDEDAEVTSCLAYAAAVNTTLAAAMSTTGLITATVASTAGITNGTRVTVGTVYGQQDIMIVSSIAGNVLTFSAGTRFTHTANEPVVAGPFTCQTTPLSRYVTGAANVGGAWTVVMTTSSSGNHVQTGGIVPLNGLLDLGTSNLRLQTASGTATVIPTLLNAAGGVTTKAVNHRPSAADFDGAANKVVPDATVAFDATANSTLYVSRGNQFFPAANTAGANVTMLGDAGLTAPALSVQAGQKAAPALAVQMQTGQTADAFQIVNADGTIAARISAALQMTGILFPPHALTHIPPLGSDPIYFDGGHSTGLSIDAPMARQFVSGTGGTFTLVSGTTYLSFITPALNAPLPITTLSVDVGSIAASGNTLIRLGIWTVAANGNTTTLVAATGNVAGLLGNTSTGQLYSFPLAVAGDLVTPLTSYTAQPGVRLAFGILCVGGTMPNLAAFSGRSELLLRGLGQIRLNAAVTGVTDLPTFNSVYNGGTLPQSVLIIAS